MCLLAQVREALQAATTTTTPEALAATLIDDRFEYLRSLVDDVSVIEIRASGLNTSALCAFAAVAATLPPFVLLSLGSASQGSPWHPAIFNRFQQTCRRHSLLDLLRLPNLVRWFASQHHPVSARRSTKTTPAKNDAPVGSIAGDAVWVLHPKLQMVPLGLPRIFSKRFEREIAWLALIRNDTKLRKNLLYANFKPRPYRQHIMEVLRRRFSGLENHYVGKQRVRRRDERDTREYLTALASYKFVLSPPGSGIDCYRHYEALLCGAIPVVEYSPLAVELLAGLPAVFVRSWAALTPAYLEAEYRRLTALTYDFSKLTGAYWRNLLLEAVAAGAAAKKA